MTEEFNFDEVRIAVPEDEDGLMELCWMMHKENAFFSPSEPKARAIMQRAWNKDGILIGAVGPIGKPHGTIWLSIGDVWYSDDKTIVDMLLFVHPDHRRSSIAKRLLGFAKTFSDNMELPMTVGIFGGEQNAGKVKLYTRDFGDPKGHFFTYNEKFSHKNGGA